MIVLHAEYKRCARCRLIKSRERFPLERKRGRRPARGSWCLVCKRQAVREWKAANPDRAREHDRRAYQRYMSKPEKREMVRERNREYMRRRRESDPAFRQRGREDARIYYYLRAEAEGREVKRRGPYTKDVDRYIRLPIAPLLEALRNVEIDENVEPALARRLRAYRSGGSAMAELRAIDPLLVHVGLLLHDVYPPDEFPELYE